MSRNVQKGKESDIEAHPKKDVCQSAQIRAAASFRAMGGLLAAGTPKKMATTCYLPAMPRATLQTGGTVYGFILALLLQSKSHFSFTT